MKKLIKNILKRWKLLEKYKYIINVKNPFQT